MQRVILKNNIEIVDGHLVVTTEYTDTLTRQDVMEQIQKMKQQMQATKQQLDQISQMYFSMQEEYKMYEDKLLEMSLPQERTE